MSEIPSRQSQERAFDRTPRFLRAVARTPRIVKALREVGYTEAVHAQGWALLHSAAGYQGDALPTAHDNPAAQAIAELDAWDEKGFALAHAVLDWSHPEQASFVFKELSASKGAEAVVGVKRFLDRLDALESSPDREATRAADHAAIADLASTGIDAAERARLAALIQAAQGAAPDAAVVKLQQQADNQTAAEQALIDLYRWYGRWSNIARLTIASKRDRISLGVSSRSRRAAPADSASNDADNATENTF